MSIREVEHNQFLHLQELAPAKDGEEEVGVIFTEVSYV